jgi:dihydrofolate reductase
MIRMIVCTDANGAIGFGEHLLYRLSIDMKMFRFLTKGSVCVVGRATYNALPKSKKFGVRLPGRQLIVLSRHHTDVDANAMTYSLGIGSLCTHLKSMSNVCIIGGATIYDAFIDIADEVVLTKVNDLQIADKYFDINRLHEGFALQSELGPFTEQGLTYVFQKYIRKDIAELDAHRFDVLKTVLAKL